MNYQDGFEFEHRCAAFLKTKGYRKVTVTPPSGDQGIDVIAYKSGVKRHPKIPKRDAVITRKTSR